MCVCVCVFFFFFNDSLLLLIDNSIVGGGDLSHRHLCMLINCVFLKTWDGIWCYVH